MKLGSEFTASLPSTPGIYRFFDGDDRLVYVGKARNLRRRLSQYRNAKRKKKHAKMRLIVRGAARVEYEVCASDLDACLLETRLIQKHRPKWNVEGAFYFLYPMIGVRDSGDSAELCYTTKPDDLPGFRFHGAFRSREITGEAFFALSHLLSYWGHRQRKPARIGPGSYVIGFRRIPSDWVASLERFWKGESNVALENLVLALVENAAARRKKREIQDHLDHLRRFWKHEALRLAAARKSAGFSPYPVPQAERDLIFIRQRCQLISSLK